MINGVEQTMEIQGINDGAETGGKYTNRLVSGKQS